MTVWASTCASVSAFTTIADTPAVVAAGVQAFPFHSMLPGVDGERHRIGIGIHRDGHRLVRGRAGHGT